MGWGGGGESYLFFISHVHDRTYNVAVWQCKAENVCRADKEKWGWGERRRHEDWTRTSTECEESRKRDRQNTSGDWLKMRGRAGEWRKRVPVRVVWLLHQAPCLLVSSPFHTLLVSAATSLLHFHPCFISVVWISHQSQPADGLDCHLPPLSLVSPPLLSFFYETVAIRSLRNRDTTKTEIKWYQYSMRIPAGPYFLFTLHNWDVTEWHCYRWLFVSFSHQYISHSISTWKCDLLKT